MRACSWLWSLTLIGIVSGCASPPPPATETAEKNATSLNQQSQSDKNVEALSAGQSVSVQTSQGTVNVEPTVVSVTDASTDANVTEDTFYYDPWEGFNRAVFSFNNVTYDYVLTPLSNGYRYVVPTVARNKISNAFDNLREPLNLVNNAFSGRFRDAGSNLGRFLINSTVGILGLFDPASAWFDIDPHTRTLADTLQHYDVQSGPYLVIPILGPSDTRGAFSTFTEGLVHPANYVAEPPESYQLRMVDGFVDFSEQSDTYQRLYEEAKDPYIYFRNQYIQGQRRDELFELDNKKPDNE